MGTRSAAEERLFGAYWDDGLLDVLCGIALVGIGLGWWLGLPVVAAIAPVILVPMWAPLRQRLVEPRAGYVVFSQARQARTRTGLQQTLWIGLGLLVLAVGLCLVLPLGSASRDRPWAAYLVPGLPAALLAIGALLAAQLTHARRFTAYAALLLVAGQATVLLHLAPAPGLLAGGVVVGLAGVALLLRFLRASSGFEGGAT